MIKYGIAQTKNKPYQKKKVKKKFEPHPPAPTCLPLLGELSEASGTPDLLNCRNDSVGP